MRSTILAVLLSFLCMKMSAQDLLHFEKVEDLQQFLRYSPERMPIVSAHRGGPGKGYPENCVETFEHSIQTQPIIIECDIAISKDSALVMMHDDRLDRTTTGNGLVRDYTLNQLKNMYLKDTNGDTTTFHIPTLDEVLNWGRGKVIFTLDVKRGVPYSKVIEAVHRCKAEASSVIITYTTEQAAETHQLDAKLMISVSIGKQEDYDRLHDAGIPDNRMVAFVGVHEPDAELYTMLHKHKIECILGTMGSLDKQADANGDQTFVDYIDHGADILSTDRAYKAGETFKHYITDHHLQSEHYIVK